MATVTNSVFVIFLLLSAVSLGGVISLHRKGSQVYEMIERLFTVQLSHVHYNIQAGHQS